MSRGVPRGGRPVESAWLFVLPALAVIALVSIFPIAWTVWESLHRHDLRMPWIGRPFVGLENYIEIAHAGRFWSALGHTLFFTVSAVALETVCGLAVALLLHAPLRARGLVRTAALLPWALPTVVAALIWRFMFEDGQWFVGARAAWLPIVLSDVWRMTPFVALLLVAGLQQIDPALYEAARIDGAGRWRQFREITLPLLRPALAVAVLFRALDAFRVFDLIFVMTAGGPGTATEPLSLYAFAALLRNLRFGYGSALSVVIFTLSFAGAIGWIRAGASTLLEAPE